MEPQKDNNPQSISRNVSTEYGKNIDHISFFEKDSYFVFVYKKTEKLATALYMVTNLFSENEPMKWTLRKKVSDMLSFVLGYKHSVSQQTSFVSNVKERVLDIVSLLEVASKSGLVSSMNFSIIQQEFLNLVKILDEQKSLDGDTEANIPKSFFDVSQGITKDISAKEYGQITSLSDSAIKDKSLVLSSQNVFKRTNRQNIIMGLLKKKSDLTIKDIAQTIRDCSEKTIQRELISLISAGIIKKIGERRWSKYSLNV